MVLKAQLVIVNNYKGSWLFSGLMLLSFGYHLALLSGSDGLAWWHVNLLDGKDVFLAAGAGWCGC